MKGDPWKGEQTLKTALNRGKERGRPLVLYYKFNSNSNTEFLGVLPNVWQDSAAEVVEERYIDSVGWEGVDEVAAD